MTLHAPMNWTWSLRSYRFTNLCSTAAVAGSDASVGWREAERGAEKEHTREMLPKVSPKRAFKPWHRI